VEPVQLAAILAAVVVVASLVSVELGVTVALLELTLGVVVGNVFDLGSAEWLDFIAKFASIVLTFLAGMEVDPGYMRRVSLLRSASASRRLPGRLRSPRSSPIS
jgi:Kef-type K+ transport system membrane component KefB